MKYKIDQSALLFWAAVPFIASHFAEELYRDLSTPPAPVLVAIAVVIVIFPFFSLKMRGYAAIITGVAASLGVTLAHILPWMRDGKTVSLGTAFLQFFAGLYLVGLGYKILQNPKKFTIANRS